MDCCRSYFRCSARSPHSRCGVLQRGDPPGSQQRHLDGYRPGAGGRPGGLCVGHLQGRAYRLRGRGGDRWRLVRSPFLRVRRRHPSRSLVGLLDRLDARAHSPAPAAARGRLPVRVLRLGIHPALLHGRGWPHPAHAPPALQRRCARVVSSQAPGACRDLEQRRDARVHRYRRRHHHG